MSGVLLRLEACDVQNKVTSDFVKEIAKTRLCVKLTFCVTAEEMAGKVFMKSRRISACLEINISLSTTI